MHVHLLIWTSAKISSSVDILRLPSYGPGLKPKHTI